jgi:acyl-CoA thioesterase-1
VVLGGAIVVIWGVIVSVQSLQGFRAVKVGLATALVVLACSLSGAAAERPVKIVALGDSLSAGLGVAADEAFPAKLARALEANGHTVEMINAGVSGDTAAGGLARLDWSVPEGTEAVILELGANDALRGFDPAVTREALDQILERLKSRGVPVLLAGMRAPPNMGVDYARRFDPIFPELAQKHGVPLYPFFLDKVASEAALNQRDGIHPTAGGVEVIVRGILPKAEELVQTALQRRHSAVPPKGGTP